MQSSQLIAYYVICTILAYFTLNPSQSRILKWTTVVLGATFLLLALGRILWGELGLIAYLSSIIAGILFIIGIAKHRNLHRSEKAVFTVLAIVVTVRTCFKVLHLNGASEMDLFCLIMIVITGLLILYMKFIAKSLRGKTDVVEVTGLFACFVFPMLISLVQELMRTL